MKYFLDTEFLEGTQTEYGWFGLKLKTWAVTNCTIFLVVFIAILVNFNWLAVFPMLFFIYLLWYLKSGSADSMFHTKNTIDLISIGIVDEDGREYYAVSKDFNVEEAWNRYDEKDRGIDGIQRTYWIRENVLRPIWKELGERYIEKYTSIDIHMDFCYRSVKELIEEFGKTNSEISEDVKGFVSGGLTDVIRSITRADCWVEKFYPTEFAYIKKHKTFIPENIYASGMDGLGYDRNAKIIYNQPEFYGYYADYDWVVFCWLFGKMMNLPKGFPMYCCDLKQMLDKKGNPKFTGPKGEHNALADAKWNLALYKFIQKL